MITLKALDPLLSDPVVDTIYRDNIFLDNLTCLITKSIQPPYSVSINGDWGSGKTTVLKLLEQNLTQKGFPTLWFNPWEYERTNDVVLAFLQQIARQFRRKFDITDLRIFSLSLFTSGLDSAAQFLTGGNLSYESVKAIVKEVDGVFRKEYDSFSNIVEDIKKDFAALTQEVSKKHKDKPLIIFIDDLDRCLPDNALSLLEALKNLFVVKDSRTVFISGIDTNIAKQFIVKKYGGISTSFARSYFKKIFNLTINVPLLDDERVEAFVTGYVHSFVEDDEALRNDTEKLSKIVAEMKDLIALAGCKNLRSICNVINNYFVGQQFGSFAGDSGDVLSLLMLQELWNDFYEHMAIKARKQRTGTIGGLLSKADVKQFLNDVRLSSFIEKALPMQMLIETAIDTKLL